MNQHLHIISFNIPYPPNYGGIIDVYYKLKALHAQGVKIILHCFEYERPKATKLEAVCEKVYYYKRHTGLLRNLSRLPYNVYSRKDPALLQNLLKDDYPILFEGLHTCYYLPDPRLKNRFKIYREANIEHDYYRHLAASGGSFIQRMFFRIEALRFKAYQKVVAYADLTLAISQTDTAYLQRLFPQKEIRFMPGFHQNETITTEAGSSDFILYHGKLSVVENEKAALFLIQYVFSQMDHPCIIAGMDPSKRLYQAIAPYPNIHIEANPSAERMEELIHTAQLHILITFQDTGLKLKLLNSLFAGRHIIVNDRMLIGSGLDDLCIIANTPQEMIRACHAYIDRPFSAEAIETRKALLLPAYSNTYQGERLYKIVYEKK